MKKEEEVFLQQYGPGGILFHIIKEFSLHFNGSQIHAEPQLKNEIQGQ